MDIRYEIITVYYFSKDVNRLLTSGQFHRPDALTQDPSVRGVLEKQSGLKMRGIEPERDLPRVQALRIVVVRIRTDVKENSDDPGSLLTGRVLFQSRVHHWS